MEKSIKPLLILMVDDDEDDRFLTQTALEESEVECKLIFAKDGTEVLDMLLNGPSDSLGEIPNIILLDLNMPLKNGWQVLQELKSNKSLRHIPVVIFTTSSSSDHVVKSYAMGANSYITKPSTFNGLQRVMSSITRYWNDTVSLPKVSPR